VEPADSIAKIGFRRWYERQLIEGHAWFVTCFVCMIAIAACMEELSFRGPLPRLLAYVAFVIAAGGVGIYGLRRYQDIMVRAESLGEHATCAKCGSYAKFRMISASEVRCRKCANEWRLID
jgi:hypothetical protein